MNVAEIAGLVVVLAALWLIADSLKAREAANDAMRAACEQRALLFLDDTVALQSLRPSRDADGRMRLRRVYAFQYSDTGHERRDGTITLLADSVVAVDFGALRRADFD